MSGHPAHMLSHLTSFVWVSAQRLTLATYIKQTISVIKQKNMFPQMQNNALSTIYMQIQVFLDVTPCSSWHFQVFDSWLSLQVSTPWPFAISRTTHPTAHHILLGLLNLQHEGTKILQYFLRFVDRASQYNCVKENQLVAQLILSIFRQPLHVLGPSSGGTTMCIQQLVLTALFRLLSVVVVRLEPIQPGQQSS